MKEITRQLNEKHALQIQPETTVEENEEPADPGLAPELA